jgi:hypothetical protein
VDPLPDQAFVVRGGLMAPETLTESAERHNQTAQRLLGEGEYALSVFSDPTKDVATICQDAWPILRHPQIRVTNAAALRAVGYEVFLNGEKGHSLIPLDPPPWEEDWVRLRSIFGPPQRNPERERRDQE